MHAAYTVFVKGITSKWRYHIRTTNGPPDVFKTLDDAINSKLLPALTGRQFTCDSAERKLLTMPARLGGIAFPVMSDIVCSEREASKRQTKLFADLISPAKDDTVTADDSANSGTPLRLEGMSRVRHLLSRLLHTQIRFSVQFQHVSA